LSNRQTTCRQPAVFLDRDGTLIEDRGHLRDPEQAVLFPETLAALRLLKDTFLLFIVTNQPGVAEGVLTPDDVRRVNDDLVRRLAEAGIPVRDVYVCPHKRSDGCACIKPNPHFLKKAAAAHGLDLGRAYVVGDHPHDLELAQRAGARGVYVLTGHGGKHRGELGNDVVVVPGIGEAVKWILAQPVYERDGAVRVSAGLVELRCPYWRDKNLSRIWTLPLHHARDLARWWRSEGAELGAAQLPLRDRRFQSVSISMFTPATIEVSSLDSISRPKLESCSLPRSLVGRLAESLEAAGAIGGGSP
jgi:D-glycero-D-manno-heptose 1,7-bisphosphate phosphatase